MISNNSIKNFIIVNGILLPLGIFQYKFINYFENNILAIFTLFFFRNNFLVNFIDYNLKNKENNNNKEENINNKEEYKYEFIIHLITSTTIEVLTYKFLLNSINFSSSYLSVPGV
jgi:ABC-type multidrug transport system permease subunit